MDNDFIEHIRNYTARTSVTASATRGQRAPGLADIARDHLRTVGLRSFSVRSSAEFYRVLDRETARMQTALPPSGRSWGLSRKLLNIFLRNCLYTSYLCNKYGLARAEGWFEVPLDKVVAKRVRREPEGEELPRWRGVKHLSQLESAEYQSAFRSVAARMRIAPVHLDAWFWGGDRDPEA